MKNNFKFMCKLSQKELKKYTAECLAGTHSTVTENDGFVFAQGTFPVLLVAHLDTVHKKLPNKIVDIDGKISSPNGIGGDDRCGIFMALEIVKEINCSVLFCEDEEVGGIGAEKFISTKLAEDLIGKFNYIIEFDRKGSNDAVFYYCDNDKFEDFITQDFYKTADGTFSDISILAPFLKAAAVNLSCGYYNAHTNNEYVVWDEMINSINKASEILARTTVEDKFEYIEGKYTSSLSGFGWNCGYGYGYEYGDYVIEFVDNNGAEDYHIVPAESEAEAVGLFCMEYWEIPYKNITDIYIAADGWM